MGLPGRRLDRSEEQIFTFWKFSLKHSVVSLTSSLTKNVNVDKYIVLQVYHLIISKETQPVLQDLPSVQVAQQV